MKKRLDEDAVEFLTDAQAIRHAPLPWWARCGIGWLFLCFALALLWAVVGRVDVIVSASGRLVSDHPPVVMKPLESSVIKQLHVSVGDRVEEGQALATFDPVFSAADRERLAEDIRQLDARFERLTAEAEGRTYSPASPSTKATEWQMAIFQDRELFYQTKKDYYVHELQRIENSRVLLVRNLEIQRLRLKENRQIEHMLAETIKHQAASLRSLKETRMARMQMEAEISDKENQLVILANEYKAKQSERDSFFADWKVRIADELVKVRMELTTARKEYEKVAQLSSYVVLRAPKKAMIHDVAPVSIGTAVHQTEPLFTLTPLDGRLEAEAEIRAEDIGRVRIGDKVRVKVTAFPFQKHGTIDGVIRVISKDAFPRKENEEGTGGAFYRARVTLEKDGHEGALMARLIPGMETRCEIEVGERRIIEYLVHPIIRSLDEAIREP